VQIAKIPLGITLLSQGLSAASDADISRDHRDNIDVPASGA